MELPYYVNGSSRDCGEGLQAVASRPPYALPRLLDGNVRQAHCHKMFCDSAIRAAWAAGEHGPMQAARADLVRWQMVPADLVAMARLLMGRCRECPDRATAPQLDWLSIGSGCCERFGTEYDSCIASGYAPGASWRRSGQSCAGVHVSAWLFARFSRGSGDAAQLLALGRRRPVRIRPSSVRQMLCGGFPSPINQPRLMA
jgi:hypothetical protein